MALKTQIITLHFKSGGMRVMAICTGDSLHIHFALQKGAINIDLILYLPIRVIEPLLQGGGSKVIKKVARIRGSLLFKASIVALTASVSGKKRGR